MLSNRTRIIGHEFQAAAIHEGITISINIMIAFKIFNILVKNIFQGVTIILLNEIPKVKKKNKEK